MSLGHANFLSIWRQNVCRRVLLMKVEISEPSAKTLYFSDSLPYRIYAYDYDIETGAVARAGEVRRGDGAERRERATARVGAGLEAER